jgi:hypothetical protein
MAIDIRILSRENLECIKGTIVFLKEAGNISEFLELV